MIVILIKNSLSSSLNNDSPNLFLPSRSKLILLSCSLSELNVLLQQSHLHLIKKHMRLNVFLFKCFLTKLFVPHIPAAKRPPIQDPEYSEETSKTFISSETISSLSLRNHTKLTTRKITGKHSNFINNCLVVIFNCIW